MSIKMSFSIKREKRFSGVVGVYVCVCVCARARITDLQMFSKKRNNALFPKNCHPS